MFSLFAPHLILFIIIFMPVVGAQNVVADLSGISGGLAVMIAGIFVASRMKTEIYRDSIRQAAANYISKSRSFPAFLSPNTTPTNSVFVHNIELVFDKNQEREASMALIRNRSVLEINHHSWDNLSLPEVLEKGVDNFLPKTRLVIEERKDFFTTQNNSPLIKIFNASHHIYFRNAVVLLEYIMETIREKWDIIMADAVCRFEDGTDFTEAAVRLNEYTNNQIQLIDSKISLSRYNILQCTDCIGKNSTEYCFICNQLYASKQCVKIVLCGYNVLNTSEYSIVCMPVLVWISVTLANPMLFAQLIQSNRATESDNYHPATVCPTSITGDQIDTPTLLVNQTIQSSQKADPDTSKVACSSDTVESRQIDYQSGTVSGLITILLFSDVIAKSDRKRLTIVLRSISTPRLIKPGAMSVPMIVLDFAQCTAQDGGPVAQCRGSEIGQNVLEAVTRCGLIALVCIGANITPLAAVLTADIFSIQYGRYDFSSGAYAYGGKGVGNSQLQITWECFRGVTSAPGVYCAHKEAVGASYILACVLWVFRDRARIWLGLEESKSSPRWLTFAGMGFICISVFTFSLRIRSLIFHWQRGAIMGTKKQSVARKMVGVCLAQLIMVLSVVIVPVLYLSSNVFRTRTTEILMRAIIDLVGISLRFFDESGTSQTYTLVMSRMGQVRLIWWCVWFMMLGVVPFTRQQ